MCYLVSDIISCGNLGAVPGGPSIGYSRCRRFFDALCRQVQAMAYLCPGLLPWVDRGPATEESGKERNVQFILISLVFCIFKHLIPLTTL